MLTKEVREHFKLFRDPFTNEFLNGAEDVFLSRSHQRAQKLLTEAASNGGFIAFVGHVGSGKTTIWKLVYDRLTATGRYRICLPYQIDRDQMRVGAIAETILRDLKVEGYPQSSEARWKAVMDALASASTAAKKVVLVIDEAHLLHTNTLKALKRVYELTPGFQRFLSIILLGQMPLKSRFDSPAIEEVSRRCLVCEVQPLGGELAEYIDWKLKRAGSALAKIMTDDALALMKKQLSGLKKIHGRPFDFPLIVNSVVEMALNIACEAGEKIITAEVMAQVPMNVEVDDEREKTEGASGG